MGRFDYPEEFGKWTKADDIPPPRTVLQPDTIAVCQSIRICCPEHGIEPVVILEMTGVEQGYPYRFGIELGYDTAKQVGAAMMVDHGDVGGVA